MILHPTLLKTAKFFLILICMGSALLVSLLWSTTGTLASLIILTNENVLTPGGTGCFLFKKYLLDVIIFI